MESMVGAGGIKRKTTRNTRKPKSIGRRSSRGSAHLLPVLFRTEASDKGTCAQEHQPCGAYQSKTKFEADIGLTLLGIIIDGRVEAAERRVAENGGR
jgi:hypothetical protein